MSDVSDQPYSPFSGGDTELDDAIEQILGEYISDSLWRIDARNRICAEITARGFDVFARPVEPMPTGDEFIARFHDEDLVDPNNLSAKDKGIVRRLIGKRDWP